MDGFVSQAQQIILVEERDGRENLYLGSANRRRENGYLLYLCCWILIFSHERCKIGLGAVIATWLESV